MSETPPGTPSDQGEIPAPRAHAVPPSVAGSDGAPRAIAVISDGSAQRSQQRNGDRDTGPASLGTWVDADAAVIHELTGVPVRAVPLFACDAEDLGAQVRALAADAGAIFLTHTDPDRARTAQQALQTAGGPPVLTDADVTAVTVTAAVLTALARAGREPASSRVVIAGAATLPDLSTLLVAVGVGDISSWDTRDARAFPLHKLIRHVTVVIDLVGATTQSAGSAIGHEWPTVISPDSGYRLVPTPGLLYALASHPDAVWDIDVARAGALALAAAARRDRLPAGAVDPRLTEAVGSAVLRVLTERAASGYRGFPPTNT